jgi:hypothetical protein
MIQAVDRTVAASESVATHFSRTMNATTSPLGLWSDLTLAFALSALPTVLLLRQLASDGVRSTASIVLAFLAIAPFAAFVAVGLALRGARAHVVAWLAAQPFPIENMNALLVGLGDTIEVHFRARPGLELPTRDALQPLLDAVSDDVLLLGPAPGEPNAAEIKLGVVESKELPARTNYRRYARFRRVIEAVIVPLHESTPVAFVRIV